VVVWGVAWGVNSKALAANRALLQAVSPQEGGVERNLELFQESINYGTFGMQEAREHLMQGASRIVQTPDTPDNVKQSFYDTAISEMQLQAEASPSDARFPLFLGVLATNGGRHEDAKTYFEKALSLSPTKQSILFQSGINAINLGEDEEALEFFKRAYELAPEFREANVLYAISAIRSGKFDLAEELMEGLVGSESFIDQRILGAYVERGRNDFWPPITHIKISRTGISPSSDQRHCF